MATNYFQSGANLTIPAPADLASGEVVIAGSIIGVAAGAALSGEQADVLTSGVFELPKAAVAIDLGDPVYYDSANKVVHVTDGTDLQVGVAVAAAADSAATCRVRLSGF